MKVFGVGLNRTGTVSLCVALEILGFGPAIHNPMRTEDFGRCGAAADITVACRFAALSVIYPDSRFVLTTRDVNAWIASCARHHAQQAQLERAVDLEGPENWSRWFGREAYTMLYGWRGFHPSWWQSVYRAHENAVRRQFRRQPERLLVVDLVAPRPDREKWRDLCEFLQVAVPDVPFPHENRGDPD